MSKERLEEILKESPFNQHTEEFLIKLEDMNEITKIVQELEKKLEKESRVRKYLRNKNKLYLNTIRKAERLTDYEANVILRQALEREG